MELIYGLKQKGRGTALHVKPIDRECILVNPQIRAPPLLIATVDAHQTWSILPGVRGIESALDEGASKWLFIL
jgi:hypothetical protein